MYISCDFLPRPCLLGSFVITLCDLSMFILRNKKKSWNKHGPKFLKSCFWFSQGEGETTMRQLEKPREVLESSLYTCFKCGATRYFPSQNRSSLLMRERPNSTIVVISTINGGMDDTDYAANIWTTEGGGLKGDPKASVSPPKIWTMGILTIAITLNVKWVYLAHLKKWSPHMWLNNLKLT